MRAEMSSSMLLEEPVLMIRATSSRSSRPNQILGQRDSLKPPGCIPDELLYSAIAVYTKTILKHVPEEVCAKKNALTGDRTRDLLITSEALYH